jgi:hypothetical protein
MEEQDIAFFAIRLKRAVIGARKSVAIFQSVATVGVDSPRSICPVSPC